jgi:hypothetical protein
MIQSRTEAATASGHAADIAEIILIVTIAQAIEADAELRAALRRAAGCPPDQSLVVQLPNVPAALEISGVLEIGADDVLRPLRTREKAGTPQFETLVAENAELKARVAKVGAQAELTAQALFNDFLLPGSLPSRATFEAVFRWSPLIEGSAYRFAARATSTLDEWRSAAKSEVERGISAPETVIALYYPLSYTMAHFSMLSSERGAAAWLADMALSFEWINWTPTFALLRERTVWLAAAAAKSAAAFGPDVIDRYLSVVAGSRHAYKLFDALFGLAAIALAHDHILDPITKAISAAQEASSSRIIAGADLAPSMFRSVLGALRRWRDDRSADPVALRRLGWDAGASIGLATRQAFRLDPSEIDARGEVLGFGALPAIMHAPPGGHYPRRSPPQSPLLPQRHELPGILSRAWGPGPKVLQTIH